MRRVQLSVYVDGDLADDLDARAKLAGLSRSAFVEKLLAQEASGGDRRSRRQAAYAATGIRELLRHAGSDVAERAKQEYQKLIERDGLTEEIEVMDDQRSAARG